MRINAKKLAIMAIFASVYAVVVIELAFISFGAYQVRVADAMLPLSMIFGLPSAVGLSLGCFVANIYGGLGPIDMFGGAAANLVACVLAWYIGRKGGRVRRFVATLFQTATISLIVGVYLSPLLNIPLMLSVFGILVGEAIAINLIGFPLLEAIRRSQVFSRFQY